MAYNSTPFHGKVARVEYSDTAMDFTTGWSIDVVLDMSDASRQGQHWKEALPGQAGWSGSFSGQIVLGNTEQKVFIDNLIVATPGTKLTATKFLLDGATNAFTGSLFITGYSTNPTKEGTAMYTFTFQGDGALTITDAA